MTVNVELAERELTQIETPPAPILGPTPLVAELVRDRELLLAANGRLARRVRALEGQLRAAGVEPVTVE